MDTMKKNIAVAIRSENGTPQRKVTLYLTMALLEKQQAGTVTLISSPSDPIAVFPNRLNIAIAGMIGGAILGTFCAIAMGRKAKLAN
jgi:uncharacterized protein involved in exopolysaccharide biosynthesis